MKVPANFYKAIENFVGSLLDFQMYGRFNLCILATGNESKKEELNDYNEKFKKIVFSFSKLSAFEVKTFKPPIIKVITAPSDSESIKEIIKDLNLQTMHSEKIFSNLNDIKDDELKPNLKIKTIY